MFERQLTEANNTDVDDSQLSLYDDGREHHLSEEARLNTSSRKADLAEVSETAPTIADEPADAQLHLHAPVLDAPEFTLPNSSEATSAADTTSDIKRDRNGGKCMFQGVCHLQSQLVLPMSMRCDSKIGCVLIASKQPPHHAFEVVAYLLNSAQSLQQDASRGILFPTRKRVLLGRARP